MHFLNLVQPLPIARPRPVNFPAVDLFFPILPGIFLWSGLSFQYQFVRLFQLFLPQPNPIHFSAIHLMLIDVFQVLQFYPQVFGVEFFQHRVCHIRLLRRKFLLKFFSILFVRLANFFPEFQSVQNLLPKLFLQLNFPVLFPTVFLILRLPILIPEKFFLLPTNVPANFFLQPFRLATTLPFPIKYYRVLPPNC